MIEIGRISAGMIVLVINGALSEMTLQFRTTVSLNKIQGSNPHKKKIAKLVVPEPVPGRWPNTRNMKL